MAMLLSAWQGFRLCCLFASPQHGPQGFVVCSDVQHARSSSGNGQAVQGHVFKDEGEIKRISEHISFHLRH